MCNRLGTIDDSWNLLDTAISHAIMIGYQVGRFKHLSEDGLCAALLYLFSRICCIRRSFFFFSFHLLCILYEP